MASHDSIDRSHRARGKNFYPVLRFLDYCMSALFGGRHRLEFSILGTKIPLAEDFTSWRSMTKIALKAHRSCPRYSQARSARIFPPNWPRLKPPMTQPAHGLRLAGAWDCRCREEDFGRRCSDWVRCGASMN